MNHLMMEQEENEREIKRLKEKEKKEANEALMQELNEWENEMFTKNVLKELRSMWEVIIPQSFSIRVYQLIIVLLSNVYEVNTCMCEI